MGTSGGSVHTVTNKSLTIAPNQAIQGKEFVNLPPQYKITFACGSWEAVAATGASSVSAIVVLGRLSLFSRDWRRGSTSRSIVPRPSLKSGILYHEHIPWMYICAEA